MGLYEVARQINLSMAPKLVVGGYFVYDPSKAEEADKGKKPYPVKIVGGCYLDPVYGRVSNFWSWRKVLPGGKLSRKEESGYGADEPIFKKITKAKAERLAAGSPGKHLQTRKKRKARKPKAGRRLRV